MDNPTSFSYIYQAAGELLANDAVSKRYDLPYIHKMISDYVVSVDKMIDHINSDPEFPEEAAARITLALSTLVIDREDAKKISDKSKKEAKGKSINKLVVPRLSFIVSVSDVDIDLDIVEALYLYVDYILRNSGACTADMYGNILPAFFSKNSNLQKVENVDPNRDDFVYASNALSAKVAINKKIRERLMVAIGKQSYSSDDVAEFRTKYRIDPVTKELRRRTNDVSKSLFESVAMKIGQSLSILG